jgi:hypothetical protein
MTRSAMAETVQRDRSRTALAYGEMPPTAVAEGAARLHVAGAMLPVTTRRARSIRQWCAAPTRSVVARTSGEPDGSGSKVTRGCSRAGRSWSREVISTYVITSRGTGCRATDWAGDAPSRLDAPDGDVIGLFTASDDL